MSYMTYKTLDAGASATWSLTAVVLYICLFLLFGIVIIPIVFVYSVIRAFNLILILTEIKQ